jgi:hypothetical protein
MPTAALAVCTCLILAAGAAAADPAPGATTVDKWKDGKTGAFALMFDDGCPTHPRLVIPELRKRSLVGTFYLVPKAKWWNEAWWKDAAKDMVFGDHTLTHGGAKDAAQAEEEMAKGREGIAGFDTPSVRRPLMSFARPGGVDWKVSDAEMTAILDRLGLVLRPGGNFAQIQLKDAAAMIALADHALKDGSFQWITFHGVGGDWLTMPLPDFTALLDALVAKRDRLWITDTLSAQLYAAERDAAKVEAKPGPDAIAVDLTMTLDAKRYDQPLTLETVVPPAWTRCVVKQGDVATEVASEGGKIRYDARPGAGAIAISPAK